jgi:uncharacterized RDD family membrane protein YckC
MERVGFLPRLGAFLIDLGIFTAAVHLLLFVDVVLNLETPLNNIGIVSLLGGSVVVVVYGYLEVLMAGTPGKKLCGLVIGSQDGQRATKRTLLKRWAVKQIAIFFAAPTLFLWSLLSPFNYHLRLPDYVKEAVLALAIVDTVLTGILLVMALGGCFFALTPARQALHDKLAGTAVYRAAQLFAGRAFEAVVAEPVTTDAES